MKASGIQRRFAANLRRMREGRGWSQEALAERADLHRTYVSGLERGTRNPTIVVVGKIARALGVDAAELMKGGKGE